MPDCTVKMKKDDLEHLGEILEIMGDRYVDLLKGETGKRLALLMRDYAWNHARHDTGTMRDTITLPDARQTVVSENSVTVKIGCSTDYAIFQEYGTYGLGDPAIPHVQSSPAPNVGDSPNGEWHIRADDGRRVFAIKPKYFMRDAVTDRGQMMLFKEALCGNIHNIFKG